MPLVFGTLRPEYSQVRDYISELGERGAPYAGWVNWAGFLPIGVLVWAFLYLAKDRLQANRKTLLLLSAVGWGYVISAFFPCDPGCPDWGSRSQMVHNLSGVVGYPAISAGLMLMAIAFRGSREWKKWWVLTMVSCILVALGFVFMLTPGGEPWQGLSQRLSETAIFGWIVMVSVVMWRTDRSP